MKAFNVLDREEKIHKNHLLEASAGTGKTFAIENMVVRLLLDQPISINQILIVTFTRAATRDLKIRIRSNIEKALHCFRGESLHIPDYLKVWIEKGEESLFYARRKLEEALFSFDQAQIFTIHGFCSRMLREFIFDGDLAIEAAKDEVCCDDTQMIQTIRDYFRTEMDENTYSNTQLNILLKDYENSIQKLEEELLNVLKKGLEIEQLPHFQEQVIFFQQSMEKLKELNLKPKKIEEDFFQQAPFYKIHNKNKEIKEEYLERLTRFSALFGKDDWNKDDLNILIRDGILFLDLFTTENLNQKGKKSLNVSLHYPELSPILKERLLPIVTMAKSSTATFSRIAAGCQKLWQRSLNMKEILNFDSLLKCMEKAIQNSIFSEKVRSLYKAAIIDEFQDTDPLQWRIFNTLFLEESKFQGILYLVGDPKQSIYSFRQADIYTYLSASESIGKANHASLNTNFRSHPPLVDALNVLFSANSTPNFMPLPKTDSSMEYTEVKSADISEKIFCDSLGSIHFCLAKKEARQNLEKVEESQFFPFYLQEISRLQEKDGFSFDSHAILVADRYQAQRVSRFLEKNGIPTNCQRNTSLVESSAYRSFYEILFAVIHSHNQNAIKKALSSCLIGFSCVDILNISSSNSFERIISLFIFLKKQLYQEGLASFFNALIQIRWNDTETILERILTYEHGLHFYEDLNQLFQLLLEHEEKENASPEGLLQFLDFLEDAEYSNKEALKKRNQAEKNAVNILTLHASKGLEFDIVFAIGLIKRNSISEKLIPMAGSEGIKLSPLLDSDSLEFKNYCLELDAEKMRQLYVAMTRAKFRLYLPTIIDSEVESPPLGQASPMELFLAKLGHPQSPVEELYRRMAGYDGTNVIHFIEQLPKKTKISYSFLEKLPTHNTKQPPQKIQEIHPPSKVALAVVEELVVSFTSLHTSNLQNINKERVPDHCVDKEKTVHTLPAGAEIGIVLHEILEKIEFQKAHLLQDSKELVQQMRPFLKNSSFEEWEDVIAEMVFNALKAPFLFHGPCFRLSEIPSSLMHKEIEFLYPSDTNDFVKGVIDLIFYHNDRYYIVDWKSNWLGPSKENYSNSYLEESMAANHYFLQAEIYTNALKKYLNLFDKRPFHDIFGGCLYLFLRGLSSNDSSSGIFYIPPKK